MSSVSSLRTIENKHSQDFGKALVLSALNVADDDDVKDSFLILSCGLESPTLINS
jgi:hypothetical protein